VALAELGETTEDLFAEAKAELKSEAERDRNETRAEPVDMSA
jgi:hypothetical protein